MRLEPAGECEFNEPEADDLLFGSVPEVISGFSAVPGDSVEVRERERGWCFWGYIRVSNVNKHYCVCLWVNMLSPW